MMSSDGGAAVQAHPPLTPLGRTGLLVSPLGLGLAGLGRPAYMTLGRETLGRDRSIVAMRRRCHTLLDSAYAAGIAYVDCARSYGLAESFVREWFDRRSPSHPMIVGSKWGYTYTGEWRIDAPVHEVKSLSLATLRQQFAESRKVLGSRLRLYQIHSATIGSGVLDDREVLDELIRLRALGVGIGLTVTGPRQAETIRRALEIRVDGVDLFETVQATWNLLEPSAGAALAEARAAGRGVIVKEVLANGRLTRRYLGRELRALRAHAVSVHTPLETLAVAAALAQPWATTVLSGALTRRQLHRHLDALSVPAGAVPPPLPEPTEQYWRTRSTIEWT